MVKIRLRRMGAKKNPYYRIVVADSRSPRDGRCIEEVGTYDPHKETDAVTINKERVEYWLKQGAQPTDTVRVLLKSKGAPVKERKLTKTMLARETKAKEKTEQAAKAEAEKAEAEKAAQAAKAAEEAKAAESTKAAEEPKAEEPPAEEPKAEEPPAEEPKAEEPPAEEPKAEEPPAVDNASAEESSDE